MDLIIEFIVVLIICIIATTLNKKKNNESKLTISTKNILNFIMYFIVYYFVIAIIAMIPLSMIPTDGNSDNGLWAYAIIAGIALAPILSFITIMKLHKKDKENNIYPDDVKPINVSNDLLVEKEKNPVFSTAVIIIAIICIGIVLATLLNFNPR